MESDATDPAALPQDGQEHRLHPLSWLFVLVAQLKQFILPLLVLLFAGRGDRNDMWGLIAVGALVLASLAEYFTYRYRLHGDGIVIRSGWLHRSVREIPFARIHNVSVQQTLLHRLVGVAEVRLESAGGVKPEAQMRVLRMDQALALEALVRHRGPGPGLPGAAPDATMPDIAPLLTLSTGELVRLGLISNRGMLVVAAAFGALAQTGDNVFGVLVERWGRVAFGGVSQWVGRHLHDSVLGMVVTAASLLLVALLLVRLLSVVLAILQYHGFILSEDAGRLRVERGLLARSRSSAKRGRIQAWSLREGVLHRWFDRRSLRVDTAAGQRGQQEQQHTLKDLAPIATPAHCDDLILHFLPGSGWGALDWQPLHRHAWLRIAMPGLLFALVAVAALCWRFGSWGLLALALLPLQLWRARRIAGACGWACNGRLVAWRTGWLSKTWNFAEVGKLQALRLSQSPLDRRLGMASLLLDTAGASPFGAPLHLHNLPEQAARDLSVRLGSQLARRPLHW
ncbi:MAG: PH domain-containing protein [Pseudomonadota bacterium]